jgi:hypothetical protein
MVDHPLSQRLEYGAIRRIRVSVEIICFDYPTLARLGERDHLEINPALLDVRGANENQSARRNMATL